MTAMATTMTKTATATATAAKVAARGGVDATGEECERDVNDIAQELGTLAATLAASTCRFLILLAEFDRRRGWEQHGVGSCSHWLSWRCGMSTTTAREQLRVAHRLSELPRTAAEFAEGKLSYSKVRAITRVATAETEGELLEIAAAATANQLDRFVAGVATATGVREANARHSRRYLSFRTEADGSVTFSGKCSPEEGAVILERLRLVQDYLARTDRTESGHSTDDPSAALDGPEVAQGRALVDALVLLCDQATVGSEEEPTTADEALGSRRSETVLHVTLDELTAAAAAGQAQVDASAEATDIGTATSVDASRGGDKLRIGPRMEMGPALHPSTARRLCCDTGLLLSLHKATKRYPGATVMPNARAGRALSLGRRRRRPGRALLRALWDRDHGCRFPGCERRRYLHAHHIRHWADGGPTNLDNLVLLCGQHHRLLHEGEYSLTLRDAEVTIYDNLGRLVPAVPPLPAVESHPIGEPCQIGETPESGEDAEPGEGPEFGEKSDLGEASADAAAIRCPTDPLPLDPVNGGPLELEYAVGVVAERWELAAG